jgi:hypothetical protein
MASSISGSSSQSTNSGANQSTVTGSGTITITVGAFSGQQSYGYVTIDGVTQTIVGPTAISQGGSWSWSASRTFDHSDTGYRGDKGVSVSFGIDGSGNQYHANSTGAGTQGAIDYDRRPGNASFASIYRSFDDIYVGQNGVSSPASGLTYYTQRSENGGGWGDQRTGTANWYSNLPFGTTQQFRALTSNADGDSAGGWQYSAVYSIPNVPSAPASITPSTPSALSCTVTNGIAPENGAGISAYYVQASPDNGATWLSPQLMTNRSYTFNGLTPGATYKFRTYAVNEMGAGSVALSASTFVPAGGRRWNGTAWIPNQIARRWNGTAWVELTKAKRWNGTAWVDLS